MRALLVVLCAVAACGGGHGSDKADAVIGPEANCFDGLDDNGDGNPDCADPSCASLAVCVPQVPAGWAGYTALYEGTSPGPSACAEPYPTMVAAGNADPMGAPAACTACSCGAPAGGVCPAAGGMAITQAATWGRYGVACERMPDAAAGCTTADSCVPRSPTALTAGICIHHDGDIPCPSSRFSDRHVLYGMLADTRACTACSCGVPMGGACLASGGQPIGGVAAAAPVTFCCIP
jgi:hypothetical protein